MKLHWSPRSPFVRKVMILAHETGLADRIDCVRSAAAVVRPDPEIMRDNPLSKIPTLVLDDGRVVYDSSVICEYLDGLHGGSKHFPSDPDARLVALTRQAIADGLLEILLLWRTELSRPAEQQSTVLLNSYRIRLQAVLDHFEREAPRLSETPFDIGHITVGCALAYLDFRFPSEDWRSHRPRLSAWYTTFAERPSVQAVPVVDDL